MRRTVLGTTGLEVSALGLGTVELGMPYGIGKPEPPDDAECIRLLHEARDAGITYYDTAAVYGRSEELIGRAFGPGARRDGVVIATKVALRDADGTPWSAAQIGPGVAASIDRSRARLGVDRLDILQIHSVGDDVASGAAATGALLEAMAAHVDAGRVAHWGASTYGAAAPHAVLDRSPPLRVLQVAYSVLDRTLEARVLPRCRALGVGLVVRSVFLQGALSDRRRQLPACLASLRRAADEVAGVADAIPRPLPEVALRFAMYESGAAVTLVGTARQTELAANLAAAAAGPLPADAVRQLRRIQLDDESLLNPGTWTFPPPAPSGGTT